MNTDDFLALVLRNPVNSAIADELLRLALPDAWIVSGCLVQTVWNTLTGRAVDYGIKDYDVFYFDPDTSWQAEDAVIAQLQNRLGPRRRDRGAQPGARPSLVSAKTWPALSGAAVVEPRHRPLPDQEYANRNPPRARGLRRLRAARLRRHRGHDRAAQSGAKFLGRKLRVEDGALEGAVAGTHGAAGGCVNSIVVPRKQGPTGVGFLTAGATIVSPTNSCGYGSLLSRDDKGHRTTPEMNPACAAAA